MSFGMNYAEDFRAVQMRHQAYRDEARKEWLLRDLRNSHPLKSFTSTRWRHFLERAMAMWPAKPKGMVPLPSVRAHRTSG